MRAFLLAVFLGITTITMAQLPALQSVRDLYAKAPAEEKSCRALLKLLASVDETTDPLLAGYKACATMIMAKHVFNPVTKMSYFKRGRNQLEQSIAADGNNIELRYLRYTIQTNTPSFLGYKKNQAADRSFLEKHRAAVKDAQLAGMINKILV